MKKLYSILFCALMLFSCNINEILPVEEGKEELVLVSFKTGMPVKGSLSGELTSDKSIVNLSAAVYDENGLLCWTEYYGDMASSEISVPLYQNQKYKMLLIANTGDCTWPASLEEALGYIWELEDIFSLAKFEALPLSATLDIDTSLKTEYEVCLVKLAAEIKLKFTCPEGFTIDFNSIDFKEVPMSVTPFSKNTAPLLRSDGDCDTMEDIGEFNSLQSVSFLIPEDMSSENELPPASEIPFFVTTVPEGIPYIEFTASVKNTAGLKSALVTYRVLLDFQIQRNKKYEVQFSVTEEGLFEGTYRVSVSQATLALNTEYLVILEGQTADLFSEAMDYDILEYDVADMNVAMVNELLGTVYGRNQGVTTVTVRSVALGAEGVCTVNVLDPMMDNTRFLPFDDPYVAQRIKVPLVAARGGNIDFVVKNSGSTVVDTFSMEVSESALYQEEENNYVKISFDPDTYQTESNPYLEMTSKYHCTVEMTLTSALGKVIKKTVTVGYPEIAITLASSEIREDEYTAFTATMKDEYGNSLSKEDFVADLYDSYYGSIVPGTSDQNIARIWEFSSSSGTGKLAAWSAEDASEGKTVYVNAKYSGSCPWYSLSLGSVTVVPVFGTVNSDLGIVENKVFLTYDNRPYTKTFKNFASVSALPDNCTVRVRHLGWDRLWENGEAAGSSEIAASLLENGSYRDLVLDFKPNGSGPYAIRFVRTNPCTGKEYYREVKIDVPLMLECGPYKEWTGSETSVDIEIRWNLNSLASSCGLVSNFPQTSSDTYVKFSYTGNYMTNSLPSAMRAYPIGTVLRAWVPASAFADYLESINEKANCETFSDITSSWKLALYDPFRKKDVTDGYYYTDQDFADTYYDGAPYLFGVRLNPDNGGMLYTIYHDCTYGKYTDSNLY